MIKLKDIIEEVMDTNQPPAIIHQLPAINTNAIANAIYVIEGGTKTKYPYGISVKKSGIKTHDIDDARQICINTINHAYRDWISKGHTGDFIDFLSMKYDPENHRVWANNVKKILSKKN